MSVGTLSQNEVEFAGQDQEEVDLLEEAKREEADFLRTKRREGCRPREMYQPFVNRFGHPPSSEQMEAVLQDHFRRRKKHKVKMKRNRLFVFRR